MSTEPHNDSRKIWDLPVRVFHWALVLAFIGSYVSYKAGIEYFNYHLWCGYTIIVLVSFRILWGIVGTYHARFWNFVRGPIHTLRYGSDLLRGKGAHYAGHNPLGALMVIALLLALLAQGITGLFGNDEILNFGPLYGYISNELSLSLTSLHRNLFYWILAAVAIHILAVVAHRIFKKENLVRAMFTGRKPAEQVGAAAEVRSSRLWLALLLLALVVGILAWFVKHAPEPAGFSFL